MRKRLFLCIIGCLSSITMIWGQHISEEQALQKAQAFMQGKVKNSATNGRKGTPAKALAMYRVTQDVPTEAYYIFNTEQNGGFVIVSGDERTEEILGYSTEGHIDPQQMPENMRAWLKGYEEQIEAIPANATTTSASIPTHPAVEPLLTCKWNQGAPYNLQCPTQMPEGGTEPQHCVTGCVATAMAQIMYYWKWPQDYTTSIPAYGYGYEGWDDEAQTGIYKYHADELPPVKFDWANMKDTYDGSETDVSADAVAQLMRYCGQSVQMYYGIIESGSSNQCLPLINYFGYDKRLRGASRASYSIVEWDELIYHEMEAGRPVWYSGESQIGGHSFVCDGYDGNGFYHFNWGWGGYCDGFYKLSLTPDEGDSGYTNFSMVQGATIGIRPLNENEETIETNGYNLFFFNLDDGRVCIGADVENHDPILARQYDFGIVIKGRDGTNYCDTLIQYYNQNIEPLYNSLAIYIIEDLSLQDGNYEATILWRYSGEEQWKECTGANTIVYFAINGQNISYSYNLLDCSLEALDALVINNNERFLLRVKNKGGEVYRSIFFFVSKTEDKGWPVNSNAIAVAKGEEATLGFSYFFSEPGLYHIWASEDYDGKRVIAQMDANVVEPIALGDLNTDGSVSITDVVLIIDVIAGTITDAMSVKAADVNQDGNVTITDCVAAIDLIAVQNMGMHMNRASANPITSDYISASMEDRLLTVSLENENHYTAFQMVVTLPNGMTIDRASIDNQRGSDHQLAVRNIGNGKYLVAGFSMDNNELMGNSGRLLNITTNGQDRGDIIISDIEFTTTEAESFHLNPIRISSDATGISQIKMSEWETDGVIFDLQGRRVNHPSRGLYIVNGSKLIVK